MTNELHPVGPQSGGTPAREPGEHAPHPHGIKHEHAPTPPATEPSTARPGDRHQVSRHVLGADRAGKAAPEADFGAAQRDIRGRLRQQSEQFQQYRQTLMALAANKAMFMSLAAAGVMPAGSALAQSMDTAQVQARSELEVGVKTAIEKSKPELAKLQDVVGKFDDQISEINASSQRRTELLERLQTARTDQDREVAIQGLGKLKPPVTVKVNPDTKQLRYYLHDKYIFDDPVSLNSHLDKSVTVAISQIRSQRDKFQALVSLQNSVISEQEHLLRVNNLLIKLNEAAQAAKHSNEHVAEYQRILAEIRRVEPHNLGIPDSPADYDVGHMQKIMVHLAEHVTTATQNLDKAISDIHVEAEQSLESTKQYLQLIGDKETALQHELDQGRKVNGDKATATLMDDALNDIRHGYDPEPEVLAKLEAKGFKYNKATRQLTFTCRNPKTMEPETVVVLDVEAFRRFMKDHLYRIDVELKINSGEAEAALAIVKAKLADPSLTSDERRYWQEQEKVLTGTVSNDEQQDRDLYQQRTGPLLKMTAEEARQAGALAAREAAQEFFARYGFYVNERMRAAVDARPAVAPAAPAESLAAQPPAGDTEPVSTQAAAIPGTADEGLKKEFLKRVLGQVPLAVSGPDSDRENGLLLEKAKRHAQLAMHAAAFRLTEKIKQLQLDLQILNSLADREADDRLRDAGLRPEDLVQEIGKVVRNQPVPGTAQAKDSNA